MKLALLSLALLAAIAGFGAPAEAQNYPWCAQYSGSRTGGATNCGFVSFEQCMATVQGAGGFCNRNTQYAPTSRPSHRRKRTHS